MLVFESGRSVLNLATCDNWSGSAIRAYVLSVVLKPRPSSRNDNRIGLVAMVDGKPTILYRLPRAGVNVGLRATEQHVKHVTRK